MAMNHKIAMHFAARDAEALERAQRRQENPVAVATAQFSAEFSEARKTVQEKLDEVESIEEGNRGACFDQLLSQCMDMQKLISSSSGFLSAFDVRQALKDVHDLRTAVHTKQELIMPRKRFSFKPRATKENTRSESHHSPPARRQRSVSVDVSAMTTTDQPQSATVRPQSTTDRFLSTTDRPQSTTDKLEPITGRPQPQASSGSGEGSSPCGVADLKEKTVMLQHDEVALRDVSLSRLTKCCIRIHGSPSTLHASQLEKCTLLCGPVSTSVLLDKCTNCKLVFGCQQMRMHESSDCDIYLHVSSRAIIEDCHGIRVAPYNYLYDNYPMHFEISGLNRFTNNWKSVDDFKWLTTSDPSPNWCIIPDSERVINWVDIIRASPCCE